MGSSVLPESHQKKDLLEKIFSRGCVYSEWKCSQHKQLANRHINNGAWTTVNAAPNKNFWATAREKTNILQDLLLWWNEKEKTEDFSLYVAQDP